MSETKAFAAFDGSLRRPPPPESSKLNLKRARPARPQEQLQEEDIPWNFEHELQVLASELQREQEEREGSRLPEYKPQKVGPANLASVA